MTEVSDYIDSYPIKKFLALSITKQNEILYNKFPIDTTDKKKRNQHQGHIRQQKCRYLKNFTATGDPLQPPSNVPSHDSVDSSSAEPPPIGVKVGTLQKLSEEILEDALVKVLLTNPEKGLAPALAFLDKKKSLTVADMEQEQLSEKQKKYYNEVLNNIY